MSSCMQHPLSVPVPAEFHVLSRCACIRCVYTGIVPYINASIILQLLATSFPSLKKLQREEGPQGRARFQLYQKLTALAFAVAQSVGQLTYIRPYVANFSTEWLFTESLTLTAGAMVLIQVSLPLVAFPPWCCSLTAWS